MHLAIEQQIESESLDSESSQPVFKYSNVENCALDRNTTDWTDMPAAECAFSQSFNFKHTASVRELRKQALCIRLLTKKTKEDEKQLTAIYRVDLFTLAIGPVHHAIDLMKGENALIGFKK